MMRPKLSRLLASVTVVVLLLAACGDTGGDGVEGTLAQPTSTTQPATTTTTTTTTTLPVTPTTSETTTTTVAVTTTVASPEPGATFIEDIVYLEMDGHEYLTDVYVPNGEGPWPVVVAFHGAMVFKDHPTNTAVARAAAGAGMVVFAPNWAAERAIRAEDMTSWAAATRCALSFVQQEASAYGGDSERTVVYGVSGGASVALSLVLDPDTELTPGCLAQAPPSAPVGAVLGDAEYFLHNSFFDGAFAADPERVQARGAGTLDAASWPTDLSTRFRLWAAADGSYPRGFDDPWDEDGWFALRDPDGTIRQDLDALGALDDGIIDYIDEGLLLFSRLEGAGIDATFEILPGGHTTSDKVPELVAYILDAGGDW